MLFELRYTATYSEEFLITTKELVIRGRNCTYDVTGLINFYTINFIWIYYDERKSNGKSNF